jgi:hypothetical protein
LRQADIAARSVGTSTVIATMVKDPEEYEDLPRELARVDQNIEGLVNKFERQSQMIVKVDDMLERIEQLETEVAKLKRSDR